MRGTICPALAVDILIKVLRRAFKRGDDVADVDVLRMPVSPAIGCSEHSSLHHLARPLPAGGLVHQARKGAQLSLAAQHMMEAQIVSDLCHRASSTALPARPKM
jgi:hypothetical protein